MKLIRALLILTLVIVNECDAFHNFTDGAEHKFLVTVETTLTGFGPDQNFNQTFDGYLHITEQPLGWLSCLMTNVRQEGFPYFEEFYEIFYVKIRNDTVESVMGKGISTENGLKIKREMIQELIRDRNNLKNFLNEEHTDPQLRVQTPMGACKPQISKVPKFMQKDLFIRSNLGDCDQRGTWMENKEIFGSQKLSEESYTSVRMRFQTVTNFQAELEIFFKLISTTDLHGNQKSLTKRMKFEYLGSRTTNRYIQDRAQAVQL